jgi:membrane-associated phospholipid phosphatase
MISTDTSANVIRETGVPQERDGADVRAPRAASLVILSGYLAMSGVLLGTNGHTTLAALHAAGVMIAAWTLADQRTPARAIGDLLPLIVAPILYAEIPLLIAALGSSFHDDIVQEWETALFGVQASKVLATNVPNAAVSEVLHLGYLGYYPLIFVPPLLLYARRERRGYAETVAALTFVYMTCWVIFAVAPVEGPRYLWSADAPDGPIRRLTLALLAAGSSRGAAFPSSHMAVSTAQAVMALRWQPRVGVVASVVAILVGIGAVYGGFHYGVDVVTGAALGLVIGVTTIVLGKTRRGDENST